MAVEKIYKEVQDYYGKDLKKTEDLKTNACLTPARPLPAFIREALECVHEEVSAKYYGCGLVVPECLEDCWILDLGCGSGRDCYMLSQLVGENGHITGIDMTEAQAGGEMYFSDVYANCDLPEDIRKHRVLWGECLAGALWWQDLYNIAKEVGFQPPRLVTASRITLGNKELENIVGNYQFVSATFRLFKISKDSTAQRCEVIYKGGITGHEKELEFDVNYRFKQGEIVDVDEETAAILQNSRFSAKFLIQPLGKKQPTPGRQKLKIGDPFKFVEQMEAKGTMKTPSGCCGPKGCC
ncbi:arsenite methyltransferase isoform X2 [Anolis carolinensis]|uniref:arsenite methyltransferase isoform X2 n=1 Tax=Anolis carolinensis TaxID=28377 RepID=UPI002F2B221F